MPSPLQGASDNTTLAAPPRLLQLLSAEVLALSSSDPMIRQTIVALSQSASSADTEEEEAELERIT